MAFPTGWPPLNESTIASLRFYRAVSVTTNWSDNAYLFSNLSNFIRIYNDSDTDMEYSFRAIADSGTGPNDGANAIDGVVKATKEAVFENRREGGIAIRHAGAGSKSGRIEAW